MSEDTTKGPTSFFSSVALPGTELWQKTLSEGLDRAQAAQAEWAKTEAQGAAQLRTMFEESARLMNESLTWGLRVSEAWRTMWFEGARKVTGQAER